MDSDRQSDRAREEARAGLRDELREVVGEEGAARAERKGVLDAAVDGDRPQGALAALEEYRVLVAISLFVALIVGAVIALVTGSWVWILVALVLHGLGTIVVVTTSLTLAKQGESPDPRTAAALKARGVSNPDAALDHAVDVARETDDSPDSRRQSD